MKKKVLIELENGEQSVEMVDAETGGFRPGIEIIWDESIHGQMPEVSDNDIGGYSKNGSSLAVDRSKANAQAAKKQVIEDKKAMRDEACVSLKNHFKDAKVPQYFKDLLCAIGMDG